MIQIPFQRGLTAGQGLVQMAQIAQTHGGLYLVHLAVGAHRVHMLGVRDTEVFQLIQSMVERRVLAGHRAALDGVEHLGGVEAEHGGVAVFRNAPALVGHAEGMGGVIQKLQPVGVGNGLELLHMAGIAVHVYRQNGAGVGGDGRLHAGGVQSAVIRVHVGENRGQPVAHDGVGGACKGEGRGDDLALQMKCLKHEFQRKVTVGKQTDLGNLQILRQPGFQLLMLFAHVGEPVAVPQGGDLLNVFLKGRQRSPGNIDSCSHRNSTFITIRITDTIACFRPTCNKRAVSPGTSGRPKDTSPASAASTTASFRPGGFC